MNINIRKRWYPVICFIVLLAFPFLAITVETVKVYVLLACFWIIAILFFSKICTGIRKSVKYNQNQILFLLTFFAGTGFYVKAFKVTFTILYDVDIFMRITYSIAAYLLVFVILSSVVMYIGCLMYKKQKTIK